MFYFKNNIRKNKMEKELEIKEMVKEKYGQIVRKSGLNIKSSCCGTVENNDYSCFADDYSSYEGYVQDADLKLGCGMPTEYANIKKGNIVLDLGSGAGNDVFISRTLVGEEGRVIGIDMTPEMIAKANRNKEKLNLKNVDFYLGEIEKIPLEENLVDVVISNCVLNLVPNKETAFKEMYRVTKEGGHFCISDIVLIGELPEGLRKSAEMYAGCVSGAIQENEYLELLKKSGFKNVEVKSRKQIVLPDEILRRYLDEEGLKSFKENKTGIYSITVVGYK